MIITISEGLALPSASLAKPEGNNTPNPNLVTANNRHRINQSTRVIQELQKVLQEQDEHNQQLQEEIVRLRAKAS